MVFIQIAEVKSNIEILYVFNIVFVLISNTKCQYPLKATLTFMDRGRVETYLIIFHTSTIYSILVQQIQVKNVYP